MSGGYSEPFDHEAQKLLLGMPLTVYTPLDVAGVVNSKGGLWLSDSSLLKYWFFY
jgi:hypothetical protein